MQEVDNKEIIAMDIGTSYSRVAVVKQNGSIWISEKIPSIVTISQSGVVCIREHGYNWTNTIGHIKQLYQKQLKNMPTHVRDLSFNVLEEDSRSRIYVKVCKISRDIYMNRNNSVKW